VDWLLRGEELTYQLYQSVCTPWIRRRHKADFDHARVFCLFVGYPRSGHSLVGAVLNAHRNAVISHELHAHDLILNGCTRDALYARILARSYWFHLRGDTGTYPYRVPHQWQGRFSSLHVIGDKRGGAVTRCIAAHPDFLARTRALVTVPLRLVHVVRNPFDNISAISIWNRLSLEKSIDFYFRHCETTASLDRLSQDGEVITLHHEEMIRNPRSALTDLCTFLGLELYPGYLESCCRVVFNAPTYTRRRIEWPAPQVRNVERRARAYRFLDGYEFAIPVA
jgi:hypothetical protein